MEQIITQAYLLNNKKINLIKNNYNIYNNYD